MALQLSVSRQSALLASALVLLALTTGFGFNMLAADRDRIGAAKAMEIIRGVLIPGEKQCARLADADVLNEQKVLYPGFWYRIETSCAVYEHGFEDKRRFMPQSTEFLVNADNIIQFRIAEQSVTGLFRIYNISGNRVLIAAGGIRGTFGDAFWQFIKNTYGYIATFIFLLMIVIDRSVKFRFERSVRYTVDDIKALMARFDADGATNVEDFKFHASSFSELSAVFSAAFREKLAVLRSTRRAAAFAAHELRAPMTSFLQRIREIPDRESRTRLGSEVQKMTSMLTSILELERMKNRKDAFQKLDIVKISRRVIAEEYNFEIFAQVQIRLDHNAPSIFVNGSAEPVKSAIRNLVTNALAHAKDEIVITVVDGKDVELTVADNGPGSLVSAMDMDTKRQKGHGLGLELVADIMKLHHGKLYFEKTRQGGTLATLVFPAVTGVA